MRQLSLIALYGEKAPALSDLIAECQGMLSAVLGRAFQPYDLRQVHATIIGLEGVAGSRLHNANFQRLRGRRVDMDISGFLRCLRGSAELPFGVRIGGFAERDRPFLSRNEPPYRRAFSLQGDKAVVMGWPCGTSTGGCSTQYPLTLDGIRRGAQRFGILHGYHGSESDLDNDFFFRIGMIDPGTVSAELARNLEELVRRHMGGRQPLILEIRIENLQVAAYTDAQLPLDSTEVWSVADPGSVRRIDSACRSSR